MSSEYSAQPAASADRIIDRLRSAHARLRRELLADFLHEQLAYAMGVEKGEVDRREALMSLGLDSLKAVETKMFLEDELGLSLEASLLFDHPTIDALTAALLNALGLDEPAPAPAASPTPRKDAGVAASAESIDELSTEEVAALLSAELAGLGLMDAEPGDV
jgi:acyl carrier protein